MWVRVLEAAVDVSGGVQDGPIRIDTTEYRGAAGRRPEPVEPTGEGR